MSMEAMCPICGKTVWLATRDGEAHLAPMRATCEECEELINAEEETTHAKPA